ncbi:MAG TPA: hypothetical protein VH206_14425 [Xanthobacteraceae bacterium]|jgi:hypothetical protein|nr:hypothetical protein [Xanthobacteraceae bacterium]
MLNKNAQWFAGNADKISTFEKWVRLVRNDFPRQVASLCASAAKTAIDELQQKKGKIGTSPYRVHQGESPEGVEAILFLNGGYDTEKWKGTMIGVWVPYDCAWVSSENEPSYIPRLGLYFLGKSKTHTRMAGDTLASAIHQIPQKLGDKIARYVDEDNAYVFVRRHLQDVLTRDALQKPDSLEKRLSSILVEFTSAVHPLLEKARLKYPY